MLTVILLSVVTLYLLIGFYFTKPDGPFYTKVLFHISWLPLLLFILFILWADKGKTRIL